MGVVMITVVVIMGPNYHQHYSPLVLLVFEHSCGKSRLHNQHRPAVVAFFRPESLTLGNH